MPVTPRRKPPVKQQRQLKTPRLPPLFRLAGTQKVTQNGIYAVDKAGCEAAKTAKKFACEADKAAANQLCRFTSVYPGDIIGPSTVNLFLRALNKDPLIPDWSTFLPTKILNGGLAGEGELYAEQHIIVGKTWDNKDETGLI